MSFPQMKVNRSPSSAPKEEDSGLEEYQFERENFRSGNIRPISASNIIVSKLKRPITAKQPHIYFKREKPKPENLVLAKIKSKEIVIDKERLYEENLALKLKNNFLSEDMIKLRTRITQIEKELNKKEDQNEQSYSKSAHLVGGLKTSIKELRQEIQQKNEEIAKLKRNIKITKIREVEVEVQAYIDECTRLRHNLEEVMRQKDTPQTAQDLNFDEQNTQESVLLNSLKKENENLNQALLQGKDEISKWKERVNELENEKKKNGDRKGEVSGLKEEIKKLQTQIESIKQEFALKENEYREEINKQHKATNEYLNKNVEFDKKVKELYAEIEEERRTLNGKGAHKVVKKHFPPKLFRILHFLTGLRRVGIRNVMQNVDRKGKGLLTDEEMYEGLLQLTKKIKKKHVLEISGILKVAKNLIGVNRVIEFFEEFYYEAEADVSSSEEEIILTIPEKVKNTDFDLQVNKNKKVKIPENVDEQPMSYNGKTNQSQVRFQIDDIKEIEEKNSGSGRRRMDDKKNAEELRIIEEKKKNEEQRSLEEKQKLEEKRKTEEEKKTEDKKTEENQLKPEYQKKTEDKKTEENQLKPEYQKKTDGSAGKSNLVRPQSAMPLNSKSKELLLHLSFRMQLNRLPKSKLYLKLFPSIPPDSQLTFKDLSKAFRSSPFSFTDQESEVLANCLLGKSSLSAKAIEEKIFKNTENWEIFTPEDEKEFEDQLGSLIIKNKKTLKKNCKSHDYENSGSISLPDFEQVLQASKITFPPRLYQYTLLLFYSFEMKIDQVPYQHFIKAYSEIEQEEDFEAPDELSDEEKAKIVRHYLSLISKILLKHKRTAADVFDYDKNGIISTEQFIVGLKRMNLRIIENNHVMVLIEALHVEDAEEVCVSIDELNEILENFGVGKNDKSGLEKEVEVDKAKGHFKKVSFMDSERIKDSVEEELENGYGENFDN